MPFSIPRSPILLTSYLEDVFVLADLPSATLAVDSSVVCELGCFRALRSSWLGNKIVSRPDVDCPCNPSDAAISRHNTSQLTLCHGRMKNAQAILTCPTPSPFLDTGNYPVRRPAKRRCCPGFFLKSGILACHSDPAKRERNLLRVLDGAPTAAGADPSPTPPSTSLGSEVRDDTSSVGVHKEGDHHRP